MVAIDVCGMTRTNFCFSYGKNFREQKRSLHVRQLCGAELPHDLEKCPVAASVILESGYFKNLHTYGDDQSATVQLVRRLFRNHHNIFSPSISPSSPALSITPERAGQLMHYLNADRDSETSKDACIAAWRADHERIAAGEKLTKSQVGRILDLINAARTERSQGRYPYPILSWMISGFAAAKAQNHNEIERYLAALGQSAPRVSDYDIAQLLEQSKAIFLRTIDEESLLLNRPHLYAVAHTLVAQGYCGYELPPIVQSGDCSFKEQKAVAVCQEDALRGLINCFVFDQSAHCYDWKKLPTFCVVHPDLKMFYEKYLSLEAQDSDEAARNWMDLVSGIHGIEYCTGAHDARYELQPSIENVFKLLNHFLCGGAAQTFDDVAQRLSSDQVKIEFCIEKKSKNTEVITTVLQRGNRQSIVEMHITPNHAYLQMPNRDSNQLFFDKKYHYSVLKKSFNNQGTNTACAALMHTASVVSDSVLYTTDPASFQFQIFAGQLSAYPDIVARSTRLFVGLMRKEVSIPAELIDQMRRIVERNEGFVAREYLMRHITICYGPLTDQRISSKKGELKKFLSDLRNHRLRCGERT